MIKEIIIGAVSLACQTALAQSSATDQQKNVTVANSINEVTKIGMAGGVTSISSFSSKEDTKGSRYLFSDWVNGAVTDSSGTVYDNKSFMYNYDKMSHDLYLTTDKKEVIELDHAKVGSFRLDDPMGQPIQYTRVSDISPDKFVQALTTSETGYSVYKLQQTKFQKANYKSDGLVESGHNYDENVDTDTYYIGTNHQYKPFDLSRKSLRKAIGKNDKAESFFSEHKTDPVTESFVVSLVDAMNH